MAIKITGEEQERLGGRFVPGQSGNPRGRPKGSRNKTTQLCADLLAGDAETIMQRLIKAAKKGEPIALKLCVERLLPARGARDRAVEVDVPAIARAADLVAAAAAVIERAAAGDITLSEAREFMQLLEVERRVIETTDLAVRIEALEGGAAPAARPAGGEDERDEMRGRIRRLVEDRL